MKFLAKNLLLLSLVALIGVLAYANCQTVKKCDRNPNAIYECNGSGVAPICGTYTKNGKKVKVSLKNNCIGCYEVPFKITSYTDGLCPGDEGVLCKNDAGGFIQTFVPVCGLTKKGCTSSSCRTTYSDATVACSDPSVLLFKAGLCPGDKGVSCAPYRDPEVRDVLVGGLYDEQDICGYFKVGCTTKSCRKPFGEQYSACEDPRTLYFTGQSC